MDEATPFPGTAALVPVLGTALLVAAGARLPDEGVARVLAHPVPRYIGRVSYAWYLWHWPVLVLANARWGESGRGSRRRRSRVPHAPWPSSWPPWRCPSPWRSPATTSSSSPCGRPASSRSPRAGARCRPVARSSRSRCVASGCPRWPPVSRRASSEVVAAPAGVSARRVGPRLQPGGRSPRAPETPDEAPRRQSRADRMTATPGSPSTTVPPIEECRVGPASGGQAHHRAASATPTPSSWRPALEQAAKERGWTVYFYAKSACTISDVPVWSRSATRPATTAARAWRERGHRPGRHDQGRRRRGHRAATWSTPGRSLLPDGSRSTAADGGAGLDRRPPSAPSTGWEEQPTRIIVLRDVPWPNGNVPSCLSEHPDDVEACAFEPAEQRSGLDAPARQGGEGRRRPRRVRLRRPDRRDVPRSRLPGGHAPAGRSCTATTTTSPRATARRCGAPLSDRLEAAIG